MFLLLSVLVVAAAKRLEVLKLQVLELPRMTLHFLTLQRYAWQ